MESKLTLIVLLTMLTAAWASICCYPEKFEIVEGDVIGYEIDHDNSDDHKGYIELISHAAGDAKEKLIGLIANLGEHSFRIVQDYNDNKKKMYFITEEGKKCEEFALESQYPGCVPDDAKQDGAVYFGNRALTVQLYTYEYDEKEIKGRGRAGVSTEPCIPNFDILAAEFSDGSHKVNALITTEYFNYTNKISDPDKYFKIPDTCSNSTADFRGLNKEPKFEKMTKFRKLLKMIKMMKTKPFW